MQDDQTINQIDKKQFEQWRSEYFRSLAQKGVVVKAERAKQGEAVKDIPLGYRKSHTDSGVCVEVDQKTAPLIQEAFSLLTQSKFSLRKVLAELTNKGLRTLDGRVIPTSTFHRMMTNPFYCGQIAYAGELFTAKHQPIISKTLFRKVQTKLRQRRC